MSADEFYIVWLVNLAFNRAASFPLMGRMLCRIAGKAIPARARFRAVELKICGQVVKPVASITYPAWSGSKRKRCPLWLWNIVMRSRAMGWPVVHRVLRWLVNKTDRWGNVVGLGGRVIGRCRPARTPRPLCPTCGKPRMMGADFNHMNPHTMCICPFKESPDART
jgi:hypothetical protein